MAVHSDLAEAIDDADRGCQVLAERGHAPEGGAPIDEAHLDRQTCGDAALADELLALLAGQCRRLVPLIAAQGETRARADAAHTLKGAARAVGAVRLAEAAAGFEAAIEAGLDPRVAVTGVEDAAAATLAAIARR